jgi:hypothetical protein
MHLKAAFRETGIELDHDGFRFMLASTVHETIVSIATPGEVRVNPSAIPSFLDDPESI